MSGDGTSTFQVNAGQTEKRRPTTKRYSSNTNLMMTVATTNIILLTF